MQFVSWYDWITLCTRAWGGEKGGGGIGVKQHPEIAETRICMPASSKEMEVPGGFDGNGNGQRERRVELVKVCCSAFGSRAARKLPCYACWGKASEGTEEQHGEEREREREREKTDFVSFSIIVGGEASHKQNGGLFIASMWLFPSTKTKVVCKILLPGRNFIASDTLLPAATPYIWLIFGARRLSNWVHQSRPFTARSARSKTPTRWKKWSVRECTSFLFVTIIHNTINLQRPEYSL